MHLELRQGVPISHEIEELLDEVVVQGVVEQTFDAWNDALQDILVIPSSKLL